MADLKGAPAPWRVTGAFDLDGATQPVATEDSLVERIKWTTLARVVLITAVLVFAVALDLGVGPQRAAQVPETLLYQWAAGAYALSFCTLLATHLVRALPALVSRIAFASVCADASVAVGLVYMTDGLQSVFQFAMPLAVLNASLVLARNGAVLAASLVTAGIAAMAANEVGWLTLPRLRVAFLTALPPRAVMTGFEAMTDLLVQGAAAFATALLSSHLMLELDRARKRTQLQRRELATLRVRYDDVVSSLPDGLLTVDSSAIVTSANPAALDILGASAGAVVGSPLAALVPELGEALRSPPGEWEITRADPRATGDTSRTREVLRRLADGTAQVLACRVAPLRDQGGQWGRVVVLRDVTLARQRETQHKSRERLAAIGSMATSVAHEIRNPLASISGAVQLLESGHELGDSDRQLMAIVQRETSQLNTWIGDFLDFARPRPLQMGPCPLCEIAEETVAACLRDPRVASAGTEITLDLPGDAKPGTPCQVTADAVLVRQTLWNLVLNACQAVLEGDRRKVVVGLRRVGESWLLSVDDSGPGIDDDQIARVFEPFFTTKGEGTGMGLALVERNVQAHRGSVRATRSPALGGARFEVVLPMRPLADEFSDPARRASRTQVPAVR
ncbi:MAG: PAS domain-containing protein [Deltaproteobacteria bacterium]|nr:PAS domain-containing protein [Deltaproteobacteria bacterium]